ncbi:unnamed protein product [Adineta steineri]|uniref:F-box domain-containing protein n=1 Tax=Adineta steineri TaxID=433720 RepID=A0A819DKX0_9BILA|nr:unnamed protein product [Adineta steineri]
MEQIECQRNFHHVYKAFYSLNARFYNLIFNSTIPIEVHFSSISKSTFQRYNKDIILPNKHRIHSLHLSNPCLYDDISSPIHILSQFLHLKTLSLNNIESKYLKYLLPKLVSLPYLSSLSITCRDIIRSRTPIYYRIIRLRALKYCSLSVERFDCGESSSLTINEYNPIEHLIIKHDITTNELYSLLSHVPQLRRLNVSDISSLWGKDIKTSVFVLPCLTHISLGLSSINFNAFEEMMIDMFHLVQVLHISIDNSFNHQMYINANRWEQLILSHMPNLRIFDIRHENWSTYIITTIHNANRVISNTRIDNFTSSFWINRQWFFTQQFVHEWERNCIIFHSIDPYRRTYYTLCKQIHQSTCLNSKKTHMQSVQHLRIDNANELIDCKYYFPNATTLTLQKNFSKTSNLITINLNRVIPLRQLTKLVIEYITLSLIQLIELLCCTPHIHTLVFASMLLDKVNYNSIQDSQSFQTVCSTNTIINVTFKAECTFGTLQILAALFSQIQHLTIRLHEKDLESYVRFLLEKTNRNTAHLCSLCVLLANTSWLTKLKKLIKSEKLLDDYILKMIDMDLYLWW